MTDLDILVRRLRAKGQQIERIIENSRLLEEDIYSIQNRGWDIRFCADFFDLQAYLALSVTAPTASDDASDHGRAAEEYARVLFFNQLQRPAILLPAYYMEFRNHVARYIGSKRESVDEKKHWTSDLRIQIYRAKQAMEDIFTRLEEDPYAEQKRLFAEADRCASEAIFNVRRTTSQMRDVTKAAGLLARFEALVQKKKIEGLRSALAEQIVVEKGSPVYLFCLQYLSERRPRAHASNETDALALATIHRLNRQQESQLFYLVSGAGTMRNLVNALNEKVLKEESIELRDLDYWKLWFAISGRSSAPKLSDIREFRSTVWNNLEGLARRNRQLQNEFMQALRKGEGHAIEKCSTEASQYLQGLDEFIERMMEPLKGGGWSLFMLEDILLPLRQQEEDSVGEILRHVQSLISEFDKGDNEVESLKRILRALIRELERLIWYLEGATGVEGQDLIRQEEEFCGGWTLRSPNWRESYRVLLAELESRHPEGVRRVFQELSRLTESDPEAFERYVIAARAYLEENSIEAAEQELSWVKEEHRGDPEFIITKALLLERKREFDEAHSLFESLLFHHNDEPVIHLHLAWLRQRKFISTADMEHLKAALAHAEIAKRKLDSAPLNIKVDVAILYWNLFFQAAELDRDNVKAQEEALIEVDRLLQQASQEHVTKDLIASLKSLGRRLRRKLGLGQASEGGH